MSETSTSCQPKRTPEPIVATGNWASPDLRDRMCFFFFQAEDGIRDADVTGVQTCALPISCLPHTCQWSAPSTCSKDPRDVVAHPGKCAVPSDRHRRAGAPCPEIGGAQKCGIYQIGRASCRERV